MSLERDAPERRPSLDGVIRRSIETTLEDTRVSMFARVVRFDASKQQVDCQPLVKRAYLDEDGNRQVASWPVVCNVPIAIFGGGGYGVTTPITAGQSGDTCLLVFSDYSADVWLSGAGQEVDPAIDHNHALADAVAILGVRPFGAPLGHYPTAHMEIGKNDAAFQFAALGDAIKNHFDALKSYVDAHVHTFTATGLFQTSPMGTAPTGPTTAPTSASPAVPTVKSSTLKVSE